MNRRNFLKFMAVGLVAGLTGKTIANVKPKPHIVNAKPGIYISGIAVHNQRETGTITYKEDCEYVLPLTSPTVIIRK